MQQSLIAWVLIGIVAGWLAGVLVKGGGFGLIVDTVVGMIGAVIGGWVSGLLGISIGGGWIGSIVTAAMGAVVLLLGVRVVKRLMGGSSAGGEPGSL